MDSLVFPVSPAFAIDLPGSPRRSAPPADTRGVAGLPPTADLPGGLASLPAGSASPPKVARPDDRTLLTVAVLVLSDDLRVSSAHAGRLIVKNHPARRSLTLEPAQWRALRAFEAGRTVPGALKHLVHERDCIPLHDFYELVLQALDAGLLRAAGLPTPAPLAPTPWAHAVASAPLRVVAGGLLVVALVVLAFHRTDSLPPAPWWVPGWLLLGLGASAGSWLAAGVVHAAHGDVYRPRWRLRSWLPRFSVDVEDAWLHGPRVEIDLLLARLAPFAAAFVGAALTEARLAPFALAGLLGALAPLPGGPGLRLLRALHHGPGFSVSKNGRFAANRHPLRRLAALCSRENLRYAFAVAGHAVAWTGVVTLSACAMLDVGLGRLGSLLHASPFTPVLLALFVALLAALLLADRFRRALIWSLTRLPVPVDVTVPGSRPPARVRPAAPRLPTRPEIAAFLAETAPFHQFTATQRDALAGALRPVIFASGDKLLRAGERHARLHLLYSGRARVEGPAPRHRPLPLGPGCLFGETPLLERAPQPVTIRGLGGGVALVLEQNDYLAHVYPYLPEHRLADLARKGALLRHTSLARDWPPRLLESFATRAQLHDFAHGDRIVGEGRENLWFYLLVEGELHVLRGGRRRARLWPGDFFGEISLLQNSMAGADVVGHRPGRFLALPKTDFLNFFARTPEVALQFEAIASRRLGRPVFPL